MWDVHDLRRAISIEQQHAKEPIVFRVEAVRLTRGLVRLQVVKKPGRGSATLDESLEDARVWWPEKDGAAGGVGLVKMANPDDSEIVIRPVDGATIAPGQDVWVYPIDFLQALRNAWDCDDRSSRALSGIRRSAVDALHHPNSRASAPLRDRQREALNLTGSRVGLLHGPPGTGKTYTIGVNIARLVAATNWRILVTATTNNAVDQALISADMALAEMKRDDLRPLLSRVGSGFDAERFRDRQHLLPASNPGLLEQLMLLKAAEPDKRDVERWIEWRDLERALRAKIRVDVSAVFSGARVVAATATSIFYNLSAYDVVPWNFLVVDEASQLPAASAVMAGTLADRVLFAGDPKQLPAVVQSEHPLCKQYLARTAFDVFESIAPSVRLNEQSRMAPDICELVSQVFYRGELVVARDKENDGRWLGDRTLPDAEVADSSAICVRKIETESQWSPKYQGKIRYASAIECAAVAETLVRLGVAETDIWILTPYRAQRALLRNVLYRQGLRKVSVSTVHRAQGGERRVVLFDPVEAGSKFLNGELGDRLLNVALSRAMARVFLFLSDGDLSNRRVSQIAALAEAIQRPGSRLAEMTLADLLRDHGVGPSAIGKVVKVGNTVGEVKAFERAGEIVLIRCRQTGDLRRFKVRMAVGASAAA
jgi:hypothetical protein